MRVFALEPRNINHALPIAVEMFRARWKGVEEIMSRGGKPTLEHQGIVTTTYKLPCERVLFYPLRDANPFFHFFESLWLLAGRNDVKWLSFFLGSVAKYSDDGVSYHGAYGYRWRKHFDHDQLAWLVRHLRDDPQSRRAVVTMFDAQIDHEERSLDIPCNMSMHFMIRDNALHLIVHCRSNDMVWGAYGANVVQFSTVLEFIAQCLGVRVGTYTQVSDSFHVYTEEPSWQRLRDNMDLIVVDPYDAALIAPYPLISEVYRGGTVDPIDAYMGWMRDLDMFMQMSEGAITNDIGMIASMKVYDDIDPFFDNVALPLFDAFMAYKARSWHNAYAAVNRCRATDWRKACTEWLQRRQQA